MLYEHKAKSAQQYYGEDDAKPKQQWKQGFTILP